MSTQISMYQLFKKSQISCTEKTLSQLGLKTSDYIVNEFQLSCIIQVEILEFFVTNTDKVLSGSPHAMTTQNWVQIQWRLIITR